MSERPPSALSSVAASALAAYSDAKQMTPAAHARVWNAIEEAPDDEVPVPEPRPAFPAWAGFALGAAVAAAFVLVFGWATGGLTPSTMTEDRSDSPTAAPAVKKERTQGGAAKTRIPPAAPSVESTPPAVDSPPPAGRVPARSPAARPRTDEKPKAPASSSLAEEKALIGGAWQALAQKNYGRALSIAREHESRFANGVLTPEREAIVAIVGCRTAEGTARERAGRFLSQHASSPLARQVQEACLDKK